MNRVAFALLWSFVFVVPWEEVVQLPAFGSVPRLLGILACTIGSVHILARGAVRRPSGFHLFAILFVLWACLTAFWTLDPESTRQRVLTYLQLLVMMWLIWELAVSPPRQRALLQAFVLGASVAALATLRNYLRGMALEGGFARFSGFNANPNELGLTLALALPVAWYLGIADTQRRGAWVWLLYLPLGLTAILLTASRGAVAAALAALVIVPWTLSRLRPSMKVAVYVLAAGCFVIANRVVPDTSLQRIRTTGADIASGYFGGRGVIWESGIAVARAHPLAGVGAGSFAFAVERSLYGRRSSHQTFLSVLVEEGIVGLLLFVAMIVAAARALPSLSAMQRRMWITLLAVVLVGSLSAAWDYRKQLWFVLGLLAAQAATPALAPTVRKVVPLRPVESTS